MYAMRFSSQTTNQRPAGTRTPYQRGSLGSPPAPAGERWPPLMRCAGLAPPLSA